MSSSVLVKGFLVYLPWSLRSSERDGGDEWAAGLVRRKTEEEDLLPGQ